MADRARRHILAHLRDHREATVKALADVTGLAPVTIRHHLGVLRDRGLVEARREVAGRGRPRNVFRLAPAGAASLDEGAAMATLASGLLDELEASGRSTGEGFFRRLASEAVATHRALGPGAPVPERLDAAIALLAERGFAMRWEQADGEFVVRESGCPYESLSGTHAEVCCFDVEVLTQVVGADVSRRSWRRDGAPVCSFRVRPR